MPLWGDGGWSSEFMEFTRHGEKNSEVNLSTIFWAIFPLSGRVEAWNNRFSDHFLCSVLWNENIALATPDSVQRGAVITKQVKESLKAWPRLKSRLAGRPLLRPKAQPSRGSVGSGGAPGHFVEVFYSDHPFFFPHTLFLLYCPCIESPELTVLPLSWCSWESRTLRLWNCWNLLPWGREGRQQKAKDFTV